MTTVSARATVTPGRIDELVSLAAEIGGIAREQAERTEANRNVSDELMAQLREAGLFRIYAACDLWRLRMWV